MAIETSYDSKYGSGDRREIISVSSIEISGRNGVVEGQISDLFDGVEDVRAISVTYRTILRFTIGFDDIIQLDEISSIVQGTTQAVDFSVYDLKENLLATSRGVRDITVTFPIIQTRGLIIEYQNLGGNSHGVAELKLKSYTLLSRILAKKDNQYGYYTDSFQSLGTSYPTKEQFEQYGMEDLSMLEPGDIPVKYEMELISETDEEKCFSYSFDLNGQHKNMKSIDGIITE